jgi:hypothetical protein
MTPSSSGTQPEQTSGKPSGERPGITSGITPQSSASESGVPVLQQGQPVLNDALGTIAQTWRSHALAYQQFADALVAGAEHMELALSTLAAATAHVPPAGELADVLTSGTERMERVLANLAEATQSVPPSFSSAPPRPEVVSSSTALERIERYICEFFAMTPAELRRQRREARYVVPRQIAFTLAAEFSEASLPQIARFFGKRDHTTVMYGRNKIRDRVAAGDREVCYAVAALGEKCRQGFIVAGASIVRIRTGDKFAWIEEVIRAQRAAAQRATQETSRADVGAELASSPAAASIAAATLRRAS